MFCPGLSGTDSAIKLLLDTDAWIPLICTLPWFSFTVPLTMSLIIPVTVMVDDVDLYPSGGDVMAI